MQEYQQKQREKKKEDNFQLQVLFTSMIFLLAT